MRKMRLDPESLAVESFATLSPERARGTVFGHVNADGEPCPRTDESTCNPNEVCACIPSWAITCAGASSCNAGVEVAADDVQANA